MTGISWIFVKATWKGGTKFVVENRAGCKNTITASVPAGETARAFSPVDAFIASLAACAGTNVVLLLEDGGSVIRSLTVKAECVLGTGEPRSLEKIHLIFLAGGDMDEGTVRAAVVRSMTLVCPIAVTIGRAAELTYELRVTKMRKPARKKSLE